MRKKNTINNQNQKETIIKFNDPIFKFINPYENTTLSDIKGIDLQDLLYNINKYYLTLRNILGFDKSITYGLELEFENAKVRNIENNLFKSNLGNWKIKNDNSLTEGAEINSPVMKDYPNYWHDLGKVCSIINKNAIIGRHSGGHIHVGVQTLGSNIDSWLNFIKLWAVYENIIYRFVYGDYLLARPTMENYAKPLMKEFLVDFDFFKMKDTHQLHDLIKRISHRRRQAVNFLNVNIDNLCEFEPNNTIEFRCPNGTLDPVIWQNNVNLLINILLHSKNPSLNHDIIDNRYNLNKDKYSTLDFYGEIYIQQALELSDLIFDNNLDKVYFLRQYFKSFQIENKKLEKAKKFTKKS